MGDLTKDFSKAEFTSRWQGIVIPVPWKYTQNLKNLVTNLQHLRDAVNRSIIIESGYRTAQHNAGVDGVADSRHLVAKAADISVPGMSTVDVYCTIEILVKGGVMSPGGLGLYPGHVHYDTRLTKARWSEGISIPSCPEPEPEEEDDDMKSQLIILHGGDNLGSYYITDWLTRRHLGSTNELNWYRYLGVKESLVPQVRLDEIPEIQESE